MSEWFKEADCKSVGSAYAGSNPALPIPHTHTMTTCKFCNTVLTASNKYSSRMHSCKKCYSAYQVKKSVEKKKLLIELLGGCCKCCGFQGHYSVFDFHHLDPSKKEFSLRTGNRGIKTLLKEAEKCVLLCANCHRLVHAGQITLTDTPP